MSVEITSELGRRGGGSWGMKPSETVDEFHRRIGEDIVRDQEVAAAFIAGRVRDAIRNATGGDPSTVYVTVIAPSGGGASVNIKLPDTRPWWKRLFGMED